eukprot:GHVH01011340.1.p1 GENE.GHVH01011340.1~~GHVH01011340.1.p1  ORF type:complete len:705 (+),score=78.01 GHVH01011340.1:92-2206(+)
MGLDKPNHVVRRLQQPSAASSPVLVASSSRRANEILLSPRPNLDVLRNITPPPQSSPEVGCVSNKRTSTVLEKRVRTPQQSSSAQSWNHQTPSARTYTTPYARRGTEGQKRLRGDHLRGATPNIAMPTRAPVRPKSKATQGVQISRAQQRTLKQVERLKNNITSYVNKDFGSRLSSLGDKLMTIYEQVDHLNTVHSPVELKAVMDSLLPAMLSTCEMYNSDETARKESFEQARLQQETEYALAESNIRQKIQEGRVRLEELSNESLTLREIRRKAVDECTNLNEVLVKLEAEKASIGTTIASIDETRRQISTESLRELVDQIVVHRNNTISVESEIEQYDRTIVKTTSDICGQKKNVLSDLIIAVSGSEQPPLSRVSLNLQRPPGRGEPDQSITMSPPEYPPDLSLRKVNDLQSEECCRSKLDSDSQFKTNCIINCWNAPVRLLATDFEFAFGQIMKIMKIYEDYEENNKENENEQLCPSDLLLKNLNAIVDAEPLEMSSNVLLNHFQNDLLKELHCSMSAIPRLITLGTANEEKKKPSSGVRCFGVIGTAYGCAPRSFFGSVLSFLEDDNIGTIWRTTGDSKRIPPFTRGLVEEVISPDGSECAAHASSRAEFVTVYIRSSRSESTQDSSPATPSPAVSKPIDLDALVHSFGLEDRGLKGIQLTPTLSCSVNPPQKKPTETEHHKKTLTGDVLNCIRYPRSAD